MVEKTKKVEKANEKNVIISYNNVYKSFGNVDVLKDFCLDILEGESFVIIGQSGSGKSVSIKIANGLIRPDAGTIRVLGNKLSRFFTPNILRLNKDMSFLFQGGALFDSMNVLDNVAFGLIESQNMKKEDAYVIAREKIREVGLDPTIVWDKNPSELSGGMQKRVALARAVATNPKVIFFDEPTTGLDPIMADVINDLIIQSVKKIGATAITITHDIHSAERIADRIGLLNDGKIEWIGDVKAFNESKNPMIRKFLLKE